MAKTNNKAKKELRSLISETLVNSLGNLKEGMGEKKFNRNIRKASKVLVSDFKVTKSYTLKNIQPEQTA